MRGGNRGNPLAGIREALRIAEEAKIPLEIIHVNSTAGGRIGDFAALVEEAQRRGLDVAANLYPYTASMSFLRSLLPSWAQEGGTGAMLARLKDQTVRAKIRDELSGSNPDRWERTRVSSTNRAIDGKTVAAIAAERKAELRRLLPLESQLPSNQAAKAVPDFAVPRNGRLASVCWVQVDVVTSAVTGKLAAGLSELTNELASVQMTTARSRG